MGEGNFSTVGNAVHTPTGEEFAIKVMEKAKIGRMRYRHKNIDNEIMMEREVLHKLKHKNVVKLYHTFQDKTNLYYLMEKLEGGELWEKVSVSGFLLYVCTST
jgi:serine/threonine protein kinase